MVSCGVIFSDEGIISFYFGSSGFIVWLFFGGSLRALTVLREERKWM
jgi:hypothetical protein